MLFSVQSGDRTVQFSRRHVLQLGALGVGGLSLGRLFDGRAAAGGDVARGASFGKAQSCILLFRFGGPSQLDTLDLKPQAPAEVRGEFRPIATSVPGYQVCEHLPLMARQAHRLAVVRSVHHTGTQHNDSAYVALTGHKGRAEPDSVATIRASTPDDHPPYGAALTKLRGRSAPWISLPNELRDIHATPGQKAGFLGAGYEPLRLLADPGAADFAFQELELAGEGSGERLSRRSHLLDHLDHAADLASFSSQAARMTTSQKRALQLLVSASMRLAFRLDQEPTQLRDRYGRTTHGQSVLLARRLIEAGIPLVTVYDGGPGPMDGWDTHHANFSQLKNRLLPPADRAFSALLDDLSARGLLDSTLVVSMGEFGRSPKVNQAAGRDHWPFVYTVVLAGGGVQGGAIYGASDRQGAFPVEHPVTPQDVAATIYYCLGIAPETVLYDRRNRAVKVASGGEALMPILT